jgi:hypothetical protein
LEAASGRAACRWCLLFLFLGLACSATHAGDSVVIFNEIQYHPANEVTQTEWIELRSLQAVDVDIGGWRIEGGVDYQFADGVVIPGGGYIVVAAVQGQIPGSYGPWTGILDNGGETLRLVNRNGRVMDEMSYDDEGNWPIGADGSGATLSRRGATAAGGADQWAASFELGGTPKLKNYPEPTDPPTVTTLIPLSTTWKYKADNVAQPAGWAEIGFDDSTWSSGGALLYAGSPNITGAGEGLYGYWALNETSGTTVSNQAPGGTAGTLVNGSGWIADGTRGRVLSLDGVDDYVNATTLPLMTLTNNFTWSFWAYSTHSAAQNGNVIIGNRYAPGGAEYSPRQFIKFTPVAFQYDTNNVLFVDYADIPTNTWIHHAMVKQGTSLTYYRNGVQAGSATIGTAQTIPMPLYFGGSQTIEPWAGRLDDVAVWTKALPASSITSLANGTVTPLTAPTGSSAGTLTTSVAQGPTTHYFRKAFTFNGAKERTTLTLQHMLDDGAVVYLNGAEVLRVNMPGGAVSHSTPASQEITATAFSSVLPIPKDSLVNGTNVLAVEVHQHPNNSDMVFGVTVVASETPATFSSSLVFSEISGASDPNFFLEIQNQSSSPASTSGWSVTTSTGGNFPLPAQSIPAGSFASFTAASLGLTPSDGLRLYLLAPGGTNLRDAHEITDKLRGLTADGRWGHPTTATPGAANVVTVSNAMVINEIYYHAPGTSQEQWVELTNRSGAPVDISLWKFSDGMSYQFPANTPPIPAGGYVVVSWNPTMFAALHPGVTSFGPFSGSLSGNGETITLRDQNDNVADQVTYADGGRWSEWADGGGSSLELRDPNADNGKPEAWDASNEISHTTWQTVTAASYQGQATNANGSDPVLYNEFVMGLLGTGEYLIDDLSVKDITQGNVELIQNGNFSGGTTAFWRIIGTHVGTIVDDPDAPGNKVLKVSALAATEHMNNHAETTLKNGASFHTITASDTYSISFRVRWLHGSNRLHTRLWHNRLARQTLLNMPPTGGTPGAANTALVANIGPTFDALGHTPVVPLASQPATVSIKVEDPNGIGTVQLFTSVNGAAFTNSAMTTSGSTGIYTGTVGGQSAGALVQFYVRATDSLGAVSFFPAAGANARAMIPWDDGRAQLQLPSGARPHNIRVVLPTADATDMYKAENLMSDRSYPCTVIYDESRPYYTAGVHLKSSEHGRISESRCGYTLEFGADDRFLGRHDTVGIDRSGGVVTGQLEILLKRLTNTAGGIYASEDDIVRVISAVGTSPPGKFTGAGITGAAIMSKTRLDKEYLDDQFPSGGDGSMHKYERVYVLTQTINPVTRVVDGPDNVVVPENPKIPQDTTGPPGVGVNSLGASKENYRWYWLLQNARDADDYSGIMNVTNALGLSNQTLMAQYIDVSAWLRASIPATLFGVIDNYLGSGGGQHNVLMYFPPGQKCIMIPWDLDFLSQGAGNTSASLTAGGDVSKFISNPVWKRLFYGHMLDILNRSFNTSYMSTWATHYSRFGTDDMTGAVSTYLTPRASFAMSQINSAIPSVAFARTSATNITVGTPFTTVSGDGWINIAEIRLQGSGEPLATTWTDDNSWSVQLPLNVGNQTYTLVAYSNTGTPLGTTTVTVNYTGTLLPAGPGTFVISELNYNPPGSGDATEFIELLNISGVARDLGNCHFDEENGQGIGYTFAPNTQVAAGGRIIIARDRAAFLAAYPGASGVLAAGQFVAGSALDNDGESIVLYAANGLEIFRTVYNDQPDSTDGGGRTLVRVLSSTNPSPNGTEWRASTVDGGNPGSTDSVNFTGSAVADADFDSYQAVLEYTFGTSDTVATQAPWSVTRDASGNFLVTFPRVLNADDAALTIETSVALSTPFAPAVATQINSVLNGNIATETWKITPPVGAAGFFVRLKATLR